MSAPSGKAHPELLTAVSMRPLPLTRWMLPSPGVAVSAAMHAVVRFWSPWLATSATAAAQADRHARLAAEPQGHAGALGAGVGAVNRRDRLAEADVHEAADVQRIVARSDLDFLVEAGRPAGRSLRRSPFRSCRRCSRSR